MEEKLYNSEPHSPAPKEVMSEEDKNNLKVAAKWAKLLSVIGFITLGFAAIGCLIAFFTISSVMPQYPAGQFRAMYLFMVIICVIAFLPLMYQYKFAEKVSIGIDKDDPKIISEGFYNLRRLYKFQGIFTVVILAVYLLALIAFVVNNVM